MKRCRKQRLCDALDALDALDAEFPAHRHEPVAERVETEEDFDA